MIQNAILREKKKRLKKPEQSFSALYTTLTYSMSTNLTIQMEWNHSLKDPICQVTQEEIDDLNKPIPMKGVEFIIITSQIIKHQALLGSLVECYQNMQEDIPILQSVFQRLETKGIPPNSCHMASITLTPKQNKHRKLQTIFLIKTGAKKSSTKYQQVESKTV